MTPVQLFIVIAVALIAYPVVGLVIDSVCSQ